MAHNVLASFQNSFIKGVPVYKPYVVFVLIHDFRKYSNSSSKCHESKHKQPKVYKLRYYIGKLNAAKFSFYKSTRNSRILNKPKYQIMFHKKAHQRTLIKRLTLIRRHCSWSIENRSIFFTIVEVVLILLLKICLVTIRRDTSVDQEDISIQSNNLVLVQPYRS